MSASRNASQTPQSAKAKLQQEINERRAGEFSKLCVRFGVPAPTLEFPFALPTRRFRWDFSWPDQKLALECDGGIFTGGRHSRGAGMLKDFEKQNEGAAMGWRLMRCTPTTLCTITTLRTVALALGIPFREP